ncbi:hypothetical protein ACSBR2_007774 [Camellia fascicularis]
MMKVEACLDSGFFYVINHGISQEFMDEVFYQSKSFFDLPVSEKMKVLRNKQHRGYTPLFDEHLDPVNQINGDYKEGYYIGIEVPENDPDIEKPLYGPNVWPTADILPGWRETMEKYHREALFLLPPPLCADSRPKLIAGSLVDGKAREARMNHPKGILLSINHENIYIAYTLNMAIRKISDAVKIIDIQLRKFTLAGITVLVAAGVFGYKTP